MLPAQGSDVGVVVQSGMITKVATMGGSEKSVCSRKNGMKYNISFINQGNRSKVFPVFMLRSEANPTP